jgi:hypothetical protein
MDPDLEKVVGILKIERTQGRLWVLSQIQEAIRRNLWIGHSLEE